MSIQSAKQILFGISLSEGGNVKLGDTSAQPLSVTPENRLTHQNHIHEMLSAIHDSMQKEHGISLFGLNKKALKTHSAYSGSTKHLMSPEISHEEFSHHKPSVGDVDVKIHHEHMPKLIEHMTPGRKFGKYTVVGVKKSGAEAHALMRHENGEVHQVDFEKTNYENHEPSKFDQFAHSSDWEDTKAGIKGMHHKLLLNAAGRDQHKFSVMYGIKSRTNEDEPWENNPEKMSHTLFGKGSDHNQLGSFHGIAKLIAKHVPKEHHQEIFDKFTSDLKRHKTINHEPAIKHLAKTLGLKHSLTEFYQHHDSIAGKKGNYSHYTHKGYQIRKYNDGRFEIRTANGNKINTGDEKIGSIHHAVRHIETKKLKNDKVYGRALHEDNDLEVGTDKLTYDRRSKTPGENPNEKISYPECLKGFFGLAEAYYPGNIGIMELSKFMNTANDKQKRELHDHINNNRHKEAWRLVSKVTGMKLHPSVAVDDGT